MCLFTNRTFVLLTRYLTEQKCQTYLQVRSKRTPLLKVLSRARASSARAFVCACAYQRSHMDLVVLTLYRPFIELTRPQWMFLTFITILSLSHASLRPVTSFCYSPHSCDGDSRLQPTRRVTAQDVSVRGSKSLNTAWHTHGAYIYKSRDTTIIQFIIVTFLIS